MASPFNVVDVTIERESDKETPEEDEKDAQQEEEEEQQGVDLQEEKEEDDDDDDDQITSSVMTSLTGNEERQEEDKEVEIIEDEPTLNHQKLRPKTEALMTANEHVTLEAELQCIICQYAMFKPMSAVCGHSFCRVCLLDSLLTKPVEEAQCPICRVAILQPFSTQSALESVFSINVTLWNLVQLLIPSVSERIRTYSQEEEQQFVHRLDTLNTKWKIVALSERAARYHEDGDEENARATSQWEEDRQGHAEYPVLKVDDTDCDNLHVSRNIVLDTNDENEDGYVNMRVGFAIMEFPSVFELYNEHQECSVNVIKMEEDEEIADGMPFFMSEDGCDDGLVCTSYYNEIRLRVCDEAGTCVMERTRGAQGGVVTFPGLRLDGRGGMYTFVFVDNLYGLKLTITTRLCEPHEISDTPVADYISLVQDEARDASRRNRDSDDSSENAREFVDDANESDDSFIVDDHNSDENDEEPIGCFSDDEGEDHDDDEETDEEAVQRQARRRQRLVHESDEYSEDSDDKEELCGEEEEQEEYDAHESVDEEEDGEMDEKEETETAEVAEEDQCGSHEVVHSCRRNLNQIVDSEEEDEEEDEDEVDCNDAQREENGCGHAEKSAEACYFNDGALLSSSMDAHDSEKGSVCGKLNRAQWIQDEVVDEDVKECDPVTVSSVDQEGEIVDKRPWKRVRLIHESESDEEQEQHEERSSGAVNMEDADDKTELNGTTSHIDDAEA